MEFLENRKFGVYGKRLQHGEF